MAVTDLTNTMWIINETPSYSPFSGLETLLGITYTSNNQTFTYIDFSSGKSFQIVYGSTSAYSASSGWFNTAYRTILITGGNDVTNATLIAWLQANAVQQVVASKEYKYYPKADLTAIADAIRSVKGTSTTYTIDQMIETLAGGGKVTDLTGTTWYFNDTIDTNGYAALLYNGETYTYRFTFVNSSLLEDGYNIQFGSAGTLAPGVVLAYRSSTQTWTNQSYRTITITGGKDVTNQDLIDWFYENATLQS